MKKKVHNQKKMQKKTVVKVQKTVRSVATKVEKNTEIKSLMPKVVPLGSRVLIKPFTKEEVSANKNNFGFIMPTTDSKEKSEQGKVLAVGAGEWRDGKLVPVSVAVGDIVAFSKYGYDDVSVDGEEYYLIKEENILAILK